MTHAPDRAGDRERLLSCPFCGDTARVMPPGDEDVSQPASGWVAVCLGECNARTDSYQTEEYAIAAWNRRANPQPQTTGGEVTVADARIVNDGKGRESSWEAHWTLRELGGWDRYQCGDEFVGLGADEAEARRNLAAILADAAAAILAALDAMKPPPGQGARDGEP